MPCEIFLIFLKPLVLFGFCLFVCLIVTATPLFNIIDYYSTKGRFLCGYSTKWLRGDLRPGAHVSPEPIESINHKSRPREERYENVFLLRDSCACYASGYTSPKVTLNTSRSYLTAEFSIAVDLYWSGSIFLLLSFLLFSFFLFLRGVRRYLAESTFIRFVSSIPFSYFCLSQLPAYRL